MLNLGVSAQRCRIIWQISGAFTGETNALYSEDGILK